MLSCMRGRQCCDRGGVGRQHRFGHTPLHCAVHADNCRVPALRKPAGANSSKVWCPHCTGTVCRCFCTPAAKPARHYIPAKSSYTCPASSMLHCPLAADMVHQSPNAPAVSIDLHPVCLLVVQPCRQRTREGGSRCVCGIHMVHAHLYIHARSIVALACCLLTWRRARRCETLDQGRKESTGTQGIQVDRPALESAHEVAVLLAAALAGSLHCSLPAAAAAHIHQQICAWALPPP